MLPTINEIKQGSIFLCDLNCDSSSINNLKRSWIMIVLKNDNHFITLLSDRFQYDKIQTLNFMQLNWYLKKFCRDFI